MDVDIMFTIGFLNRVVWNTRQGKPFFPIYFSRYDPRSIQTRDEESTQRFAFDELFGTWRYFSYGIVGIYTSDILDAGNFDRSLQGWGMEDVEFYHQCLKSKLQVFRSVDLEPVHYTWPTAVGSGIIKMLGWTSVTIITNHETETEVSLLVESTDAMPHTILRVGPTTNRTFLQDYLMRVQLMQSRHHNYLVVCGRTCIADVLDVVNNLDAESGYRTFTRSQSRWVVLEPPGGFPNLTLLGDQLDNLVTVNQTGGDIDLYTLMWAPGGREWRQINMDACRQNCSLASQIFPNSFIGYNGKRLTVALMEWRQFIIRYVLVEPPDRRWGVEINGHWDGIVRQLIDREVDFTIAPLAMSSERQRVIDFLSTPISYEYSDIAFRRLDKRVSKWRLLLDLFHPKVYLCLSVNVAFPIEAHLLLLQVNVAFPIEVHLLLLLQVNVAIPIEAHLPPSVNVAIPIEAQLLLQVNVAIPIEAHLSPPAEEYCCLNRSSPFSSCGLIPQSGSGRMLISSWCLFSVIMASIFSGKLIATLAVPKTPAPFLSLTEMLNTDWYTWGIVGGEAHQQFISESTDDVLMRLWQAITESNKTSSSVTSSNVSKHMDHVLRGEYALVYTRYKQETPWSCDVDFLGQKIAVFTASLAMPKNSPIAPDFNKVLMALTDRGILQRLERRWLSASSTCGTTTSRTREVTEQDLQSAFYTLIIGIVSASFVLGTEVLYVRIVKAS
ncbi:glutamate receptor ionotropic, kainate 5-like [Haliotis rubra]|uniref:glutamate receptor ionotropic, kainate 5-like n=1 Tax=Haliotis rubra TaxID=36100 RepID=UPI001EE61B65|nr:glutamate receptor ionotropic, kainate 5-like [Haliotis rubra]